MFLQQIAVSVFFPVYILTCRALYYYDHLKYAAYLKSPNIWFEAAAQNGFKSDLIFRKDLVLIYKFVKAY